MNAMRSMMFGAGIGAGTMFLLDPTRGARRRALLRDKASRAAHKTRDAYDATQRDLSNRVEGMKALLERRSRSESVDDRTLAARVRAQLGRVASHPRAIRVDTANGSITLTGDVLADEVSGIVNAVGTVRGVADVSNQMTPHDSAAGVPALQGTSPRPGRWTSWASGSWSPTARLVAGVGAAASVATAVAIRGR